MEKCSICKATMVPSLSLCLLQKYQIQYFRCASCGYLRTEKPYWLEEAYASAIAVTDTGIMARNVVIAAKLACLLFYCLDHRGAHVDVAGGYGILTRLMRDYGFDCYWDDKHCENLVARGFEASNACVPFSTMSAFEAIEHIEEPLQFVESLMQKHRCRTLIFSTQIYAGDTGPDADWWYLSPRTGQHISFFQQRTLQHMATRLNLRFSSEGGLHLFSERGLRNRWLLPLLARGSGVLAKFVGRQLGSRIWADHLQMSNGIMPETRE